MKGSIIIVDGVQKVSYLSYSGNTQTLPIIENQLELTVGDLIEFKIVDEFSHPQLFISIDIFEGLPSALIFKRI